MSLDVPVGPNGAPVPIVRLGQTNQSIAYNAAGGASAQSATFQASTEAIMLTLSSSDGDLRVAVNNNPTASGTSALLAHPGVYYLRVRGGTDKIAVLSNSTTTGTVTINELQGLG